MRFGPDNGSTDEIMAKASRERGAALDRYRAKRHPGQTPEPFGEGPAHRPRLFVVQKHAARRLHYDLRLELGGVLHSWAVPKGPSFSPEEKRLAMHVEQHPVEYADFEGVIPEGNYGAGSVIVWDRGRWIPQGEPPEQGLAAGKLLFDLVGYKLRGRWTLFRIKGESGKEWLLMKKPDDWADPDREPVETSILSGLAVERLAERDAVAAELRAELARRGVPRGAVRIDEVEPMLAQPHDRPFSKSGWVFELKYDGYRLLAAREGGRAHLRYRRGQEVTGSFPELALAVRNLPYAGLVIDGELVVLDEAGRPSFQKLQQRVQLRRQADIERATVELPVTMVCFDLLAVEGHDLRSLPLTERKAWLERVLPAAGPLRWVEHIEERGAEMHEAVQALGVEGIVAKRADSTYRAGRHGDWLKIRADRTAELAIAGFTEPARGRPGFGALLLAVNRGGRLVYAGRVGTGFDERTLVELRERLEASRRDTPACEGAPRGAGHVWVEPQLVAEVRYKEWTDANQLRHPVFVRLREDKSPADCVREAAEPPREAAAPREPPAPPPPAERRVRLSNLDKVFWPEEGYTKGDLIAYYRAVADWILPYLARRPVVLTRYPDGIHGKSFFQKDAPGFAPDWIRTETMWSEHAERQLRYFICDDEPTLTYLANLGTIPLHVWSSRIDDLEHPDWCILDLDPKGAPFEQVVEVAKEIHELCESIGLESFVKSSGSTGLHVLLPLGGRCTFEQTKQLGEALARVIAGEHREIATIERSIPAREGRVYVDFLQNGQGKLLVAPLSVRPLPGAPVSVPLHWREVNRGLHIERFTIANVPARLRRMKADPLAGVLGSRPDLPAVLERLVSRLRRVEA